MDPRQPADPSFSIVIPTLNEVDNIYPLLTRIFDIRDLETVPFEVVFVDDNSTDGTREAVCQWQKGYPVRLICREAAEGLAGAVVEGARAARGDIVVVMDADLSHPPEALPALIGPLLDGSRDMVIGSRYTPGGTTPDWPPSRRIASWLATLPARILSDPCDPLAGFFAVRRKHLAGLDMTVSGFKIGLETLVAGRGEFRVAEIPITFYDRYTGKSKMNRRVILEYVFQVLGLCGVRPAATFATGLRAALVMGVVVDALFFALLQRRGLSLASAHIAGFVGACLVTTPIHCRWTFPGREWSAGRAGGIVVVSLLALALRGGLLGDALRLGLPQLPALVVSSLISLLFAATALAFFIFNGPRTADVTERLFCLGVIVYALVLRLAYLGLPALLEEEAYYWNYAQHPAMGYLDHPPMVAVLIRLGTALCGTSEFAVRLAAVACWMTTAWFTYALTRALAGRLAGFRAVMLLSALPAFFAVGLLMTPDAPLTACWSAVIYFLYQALLHERPRAWVGVGIALGLGMFSKYTVILLGPAIVLFVLLDSRSRRWLRSPWPYLAALIALGLFAPVIVWNAQHHWASFLFQSERRVTAATHFTTHVLLGQILLLLTPTGVLGLFAFLAHGRLFLQTRRFLFFLLLVVIPLTVFVFFSLTKEVQLNWTGPLWLGLVPFLAASMAVPDDAPAVITWCRRLWPATAISLLLLSGAFLHYYSLGLPGVPTLERPFLAGWDRLATEIDAIVAANTTPDGTRPVVVGMDKYRIASGLAFYRYKHALEAAQPDPRRAITETTGWHVFGWTDLMYAFWLPPAQLDGKNLLLVAFSMETADDKFFASYVDDIGPVQTLDVKMAGKDIDHCYIRLVQGYHHEGE